MRQTGGQTGRQTCRKNYKSTMGYRVLFLKFAAGCRPNAWTISDGRTDGIKDSEIVR